MFPAPTWSEREFSPSFYSEANEKVMIAINSICIFLTLMLVGVVVWNWKTPVIRAATPSFCLVIIAGGVMMLMSNYFNTLGTSDASDGAPPQRVIFDPPACPTVRHRARRV